MLLVGCGDTMPRSGVEYATDQITVYRYCPYGCKYCYVWRSKLFSSRVQRGRYDPVEEAEKYLRIEDKRTIVVSFVSDPYPPDEVEKRITRRVLEKLFQSHHRIMVLTKNPVIPVMLDLDLFVNGNDMWLGSTIVVLDGFDAGVFEPKAPNPWLRLWSLKYAKSKGVKTWLSIEPIIPWKTDPVDIIEETKDFIDYYVLGALNYSKQLGYVFSKESMKEYYQYIVPKAIKLLEKYGKQFFIKKELRRYLEE